VTVYVVDSKDDIVSKVLSLTKTYLGYFERYFGINYTLPKLDIVTTSQFKFVGMEHWGAIVLENYELEKDVKRSGSLLAHEVIHQ
ncbi:unnamed protein product, partial [Ixodes persulcatus]